MFFTPAHVEKSKKCPFWILGDVHDGWIDAMWGGLLQLIGRALQIPGETIYCLLRKMM